MADTNLENNLPSDAVLESVSVRAFQFIRAVSCNAGIRAAFAQRGYSDGTHQQAWADILKAAGFRKDAQPGFERPEAAAALAQVDAWDEPTFRIARAVLAPFPAQQAFVFNGLEAQTGAAAVHSVTTFLDRLDQLENSPDRKATRKDDLAAIAKLAERRIDAAERNRMRGLLQVVTGFAETAASTVQDADKNAKQKDERRKAQLAVWYYLNEWSEIARTDIARRDYLIQLGLVKRKKLGKGESGKAGAESSGNTETGAGGGK